MNYRKAEKNDIPQLIEIRLAYLKENHIGLTDVQCKEIASQFPQYFDRHLNKDLIAYICEMNDKIISSVFLHIISMPANPSTITGKNGILLNVYTEPASRKKGIATKLLSSAIADARQMNLSFIELDATDCGYPVYEKIGFIPVKSNYTHMKLVL